METIEEVLTEEIISNEELEQQPLDDITANYIVLCEEKSFDGMASKVYEQTVCGESLADWTGRACATKPVFLTLSEKENFLDLIRPYTKNGDYTVVLFASTPLVTKTHIRQLLSFVSRKSLNVCTLKKGYILKNSYIANVDEIYSSLKYNISSNDFFEVRTIEDLSLVREMLTKRMLSFHKKNGVIFENEKLVNLDSNVFIGFGTQIFGGVTIQNGSYVGEDTIIESGTVISNSKIGDGVIIESGAVVKNSIVKSGAVIEAATVLSRSVVGEKSRIALSSRLSSSSVKENVLVDENCYLFNANVQKNAVIGKNSNLVGSAAPVAVGEGKQLEPCTNLGGRR